MSQPHDAFFKSVFGHPELAADLVRRTLPAPALAALDLDRLEPVGTEFVDPALRGRRADLLFRAPVLGRGGGDAYVFLLMEHQSTPDHLMALRVLDYAVEVWKRYVERERAARRAIPRGVPAVIPIVVYQGRRPWRTARSLGEIIDLEPLVQTALEPFLPRLTLLVDDLADDADVTRDTRFALSAAALLTMRFVRIADDPGPFIARWSALLDASCGEPHRLAVVDAIVRYLYHSDERLKSEDIVTTAQAITDPQAQEVLMNLAQKIRQEGHERGREEGREEGREQGRALVLLRQITLKFGAPDEATRRRITEAGPADLDAWTDRILTAGSLAEMLAPDAGC